MCSWTASLPTYNPAHEYGALFVENIPTRIRAKSFCSACCVTVNTSYNFLLNLRICITITSWQADITYLFTLWSSDSCKNSLWSVGYYLGYFRNGLPNWSSALGKPCMYTKLILKTYLYLYLISPWFALMKIQALAAVSASLHLWTSC